MGRDDQPRRRAHLPLGDRQWREAAFRLSAYPVIHAALLLPLVAVSMARVPHQNRIAFIVCNPTVIVQPMVHQRWITARETCYIRKALLPPMIVA
jgi:hypothetical protein